MGGRCCLESNIRNAAVTVYTVLSQYADESKTVFKKPTRLECMMQVQLTIHAIKCSTHTQSYVGDVFVRSMSLTCRPCAISRGVSVGIDGGLRYQRYLLFPGPSGPVTTPGRPSERFILYQCAWMILQTLTVP